jgi:hypothetical protein
MSILLTSCNIVEGDVAERISSPDNNIPPILGKWVIDEVLQSSLLQINSAESELYIGKEGLFHKDAVVIGDNFTTKPSYKIKYVKASDYLLYKYKASPKMLGIEDEQIEVITILNDNAYFYEFMKISDDLMLINIDDTFYKMSRTVKEVSVEEIQRYISVEKSMLRTLGAVEEENIQSGILLGLKTPSFDEENQVPIWEYKTIWINSHNKFITGIYSLDKILMPRKNGFWIIDNKRTVVGDSVNDELVALPQFRVSDNARIDDDFNTLIANNEKMHQIRDLNHFNMSQGILEPVEAAIPSILKNILFVGNDYISIENIDLERSSRKTLQVYAIDNLDDKKPIKLTDLIGENGKDLFQEGARSVISLEPDIILNEENVGLDRRNGYWILKGRVNYRKNDEELYKDFNIKTIPPKEMVSFDEQVIPWDAIRLRIPDVIDVFSSPNEDFVVVITSSHIVVYYIENGDIVNTPAVRIKLPYDSTIIMSEWALGRYPNIWQNIVIDNGGVQLEY